MVDWEDLQQLTDGYMDNPLAGDLFHEMYCFWLRVTKREGPKVFTEEGNSDSGWSRAVYDSVDEFKRKFAYGTIDGYSVQVYTRTCTASPKEGV